MKTVTADDVRRKLAGMMRVDPAMPGVEITPTSRPGNVIGGDLTFWAVRRSDSPSDERPYVVYVSADGTQLVIQIGTLPHELRELLRLPVA
jgi:hypothetical protein